jgi:acetyl-CoA carboxylase carboxyl transferase subunit alpha
MSDLKTPIICTVIGEGGSGGALAIGVGDRVMMLEYSTYSVISPEGCASILWKSADKAPEAAEAMGITAGKLKDAGLIDQIIREPLGSAHRDVDETARNIKQALIDSLEKFEKMSLEQLLEQRYARLTSYGEILEQSEK